MTADSAAGARYYNAIDSVLRGCCPNADPNVPVMPVIMALTPWTQSINSLFGGEVKEPTWSIAQDHRNKFVECIKASEASPVGTALWTSHRQAAHWHRMQIQALGHDICAPMNWELDEHWPRKVAPTKPQETPCTP